MPVTAEVSAGSVQLHVGALTVPLASSTVGTLSTETVPLKGGVSIGIVRLSAAGHNTAVLVAQRTNGALEALWTGQLDLHGDPGERRADALEVGDRDGDGKADVVVGSYDEQVRVCGADRTLLGARAIDPKTLSLRAVLLNRHAERAATVQLSASTDAPALHAPPTLHALRAVSSSSTTTDLPASAAALVDGDLTRGWAEGRGLGGRFEFVTLSWTAPNRPITALAVVPLTGEKLARVRTLSVLGPKGERLAVTLPERPSPKAGERYWIKPPTPLAWSCLTVMVDDVAPEGLSARTHSGLAELEAYTTLDQADAVPELIAELAQPGARGDDAVVLLQQLRSDTLTPLVSAWPTLPSLGKRRALRLIFAMTGAPDERARELLGKALHDGDPELNTLALKLAAEHVELASPWLVELAAEPTPAGDQAAKLIAHTAQPTAFASLLGVLEHPHAGERVALREALSSAYRAHPETHHTELAPWLNTSDKPAAERVALALALAQTPEGQAVVTPWLAALVTEPSPAMQEFGNQWRLVQTAALLPSEANVDRWLTQLAQTAKAWMLRAAALDVLEQRNHTLGVNAAQRALGDEYPRVRASAVNVLASATQTFEPLQKTVREDPWFIVRKAPLVTLPDSTMARAYFADALSDRTPIVRATAIAALRRVGAKAAWSEIAALLDESGEFPEVLTEGVSFASALCVHESASTLKAIATRGLAPNAGNADQELALDALEALGVLGGDAANWAHHHAAGPQVPKSLQLTAAAAAQRKAACQPQTKP